MQADVSTRERLLTAAMALFGVKGYRATTVGQIEQAAGLSPRAGAFYRHFTNKEAVFHAALDRWIADVSAFPADIGELLPLEDLRSELTVIARGSLRILGRQLDLFRLLARDAVEFPALVSRVHDELVSRGYRQMEGWFAERLEARGRVADPAALAAVALSALVHYREDEAVYGVPPAGVAEEDFVRAWVDVWTRWFD